MRSARVAPAVARVATPLEIKRYFLLCAAFPPLCLTVIFPWWFLPPVCFKRCFAKPTRSGGVCATCDGRSEAAVREAPASRSRCLFMEILCLKEGVTGLKDFVSCTFIFLFYLRPRATPQGREACGRCAARAARPPACGGGRAARRLRIGTMSRIYLDP